MAFQPFFKILSNFNPNQSQHHSVTLIKAKNDLFDEELAKCNQWDLTDLSLSTLNFDR